MAKNLSNICPSGPEWNALVNHPDIGLYEAVKDWMDHDGEIRSVDIVLAKLRKETISTRLIKPGVSELFESNSELAFIGTQEQYSQYLDTIFPDSKVKDIVYHGSNQIYILGSKQDIEGFKEFVSSGVTSPETQIVTERFKDTYETNNISPLVKDNKETRFIKRSVESLKTNNKALDDLWRATPNKKDFWNSLVKDYNIPAQIVIQLKEYDGKSFSEILRKYTETTTDYYRPSTLTNRLLVDEASKPTLSREQEISSNVGLNNVKQLISRLQQQFPGINVEYINAQEARLLTASSVNPWNNEPAFYFNGTTYFVSDSVTAEMAFHEFSHPFIQAIYKNNPELFNNLYQQLSETPEGKEIINEVKELYPDLADDIKLKEESLVRAISMQAAKLYKNEGSSKSFAKLVKDLITWIKNKIKELFKVKVVKLDPNTSIETLGEMLAKGTVFELGAGILTGDQVVDYARRSLNREFDDIMTIANNDNRQDLINLATQGYKATTKSLRVIKDSNDSEEMLKVLADQFGLSNIEEMRKNLSKYTDMMQKRISTIIEDIDYTTNHVEALVNTYYRLSKTIPKITEHLKQLVKDPNKPENIQKSFAYGKVLEYWQSWLNFSVKILDDNNIPTENSISKMISGTLQEIKRAQSSLAIIRGESLKETLYSYFLPLSETAKERFDSAISTYKKYNAQGSIDRMYKEYYGLTEAEYNEMEKLAKSDNKNARYELLKAKSYANGMYINQEKIQLILEGQLNDVPALSSFIEGYMYQDDPVVGGFSLFVKNAIDSVMVKSQMRYNEFSNDIVPLLEKLGYNPTNVAQLGDKVLFKDTIAIEQNGEPVEKKIWTLINPYKDYRSVITKMEYYIKKAHEQYIKTNLDSDKDKLNALVEAKMQHDIKYMHQEYVPELYEIRNKFTDYGRDSIAVEALHRRDLILEEIRKEQEAALGEEDFFEISGKLKELWNQFRLLHSLTDINGRPKTNETKNGVITNDLAIAKKLIEYRESTKKFYEYKLIPGSFESALSNYEQSLRIKGIKGDQFTSLRNKWLYANTRVKIKPEFFTKRRELLTEIAEIYATDNKTKKGSEELKELYKVLNDAITGFRDDDGQPDGSIMSEARLDLIKETETRIEEVRSQMEEVKDKILKKRLNALWREFSELSTTEPTDYYDDQINAYLSKIKSEDVKKQYKSYTIDKEELNSLINGSEKSNTILNRLLQKDEDFAEWFNKNHVKKTYTDSEGSEVTFYKRTYAWNVIRPKDMDYVETYDIKDENGKIEQVIDRVPAIRFYKREVKDEYKTGYNRNTGKVELTVGTQIDNKGNWLPRADVKDSPYRNEEYYKIKETNKELFAVLEKLKEFHLKNQEGADKYTKLYLDLPRFEQERLEILQNKKKSPEEMGIFQKTVANIKQFFMGSKEMPESGYKWEDEFAVSSMEIFDNEERNRIPIHGLYDIDIDMTSKNVTNSLLRYMFSIEKNKKLSEIHPTALALKELLLKNDSQKFKDIKTKNLVHQGEFNYRNKDMNERRRKVIDNFIDREFYGQTTIGIGSDSKPLHNIMEKSFGLASFGYFAFNITSALKNVSGQKIQNLTEAIAGRYYGPKDLAAGKAWAWKMMPQLSANIYSREAKPLSVQLWELFDPTNSLGQKAAKEGLSRTLLSDLVNNPVGITMNFRKWTELHGSAEVLGAMLNSEKVDMGGKKIPLLEAWEVVDGKIQLKKGVDPEWGVTYDENGEMKVGKKFLAAKNKIEAVLRNLAGAYDSFNQPELNRYVLGKAINYLRKYLTTMTIDRLGFRFKDGQLKARIQPGLGTATEGFYITVVRYLKDVLATGGKRLAYMTKEERAAWAKTLADAAVYLTLTFISRIIFAWDPDDEERFQKLREKSGPLRGPFIAEDDYDFHMGGWVSNHLLNLSLQVQAEQGQFIPLPGLGLSGYVGIASEGQFSALFGPTISTLATMTYDSWNLLSGNRYAYYSKDVGPYEWQKEDSFKFINHMAKSIGLTGSFYEPIQGLKSWEYAERTRTTGF